MNILRLSFLLLIGTEALVAGEVSAAFKSLVAEARSVRLRSVPQEKGEKGAVADYATRDEVSRVVAAFDFVDPKPIRMPDGTVVYAGPCKCLPTHLFTFTLRDGAELVLFVDAEDLKDIGVEVQKEDIQRLQMPWHTTLALSPDSTKSVASLLKNLNKKEANQSSQPTRGKAPRG